jgi:hypothetical protein
MKILYLVIHTEKQKDRYENIMSTWGKDVEVIFYSDESSKENIIKVSDKSDYSSGEEKQINIINNFPKEKLNYDWYVFVDNDTFVNTKKVSEIIDNFDPNHIHGQVANTYHSDPNLFYCLGGAGIFISNTIMTQIIGKLVHNNVIWGDVSLGLNLRKLGIKLQNNLLCHSQRPEHYGIQESEVKNHITFHYITDLYKLKEYLNICQ